MDRNLHAISILLVTLFVSGICSCTKGGTHPIRVNVNSVKMEKGGGEASIDAGDDRIDDIYLWSWDKKSKERTVDIGYIVYNRYYETYGPQIYSVDFVTPETLIIEANDWLTIIIPPHTPASGVHNFKIRVKENNSGSSRDRWLELGNSGAGQAWVSLRQPGL